MGRRWVLSAIAVGVIAGLLFAIFPQLDLAIPGLFFDPVRGTFPLAITWFPNLIRTSGHWTTWLIVLAAGGAVNLALDGGAAVEVAGPARLTLEGSSHAVAVRLTEGRLSAQVTHRRPDETFAVITRHARVEVRGTQFSVAASGEGTHVEVLEGRVAVLLDDGRSTVEELPHDVT